MTTNDEIEKLARDIAKSRAKMIESLFDDETFKIVRYRSSTK